MTELLINALFNCICPVYYVHMFLRLCVFLYTYLSTNDR